MPEKKLITILFFGLLVTLSLTPHIYAIPIELKANGKNCPADLLNANLKYLKGGLIINTDFDQSIYSPVLLKPLQTSLKNNYWTSLSLANTSNIELNTECLTASIDRLKKETEGPIFMVTHGQSYKSTMKYFIEKRPIGVLGLIAISPYPYNMKEDKKLFEDWVNIRLPMLIIYNQRDYDAVLNTVKAIKATHSKQGNELLREKIITAGNPGSSGYDRIVTKNISSWLYFVKRHIDFVARNEESK